LGRSAGDYALSFLLDTHILLRWFEGTGRLSARQTKVLEEADASEPLLVAEITLWEVAVLASLGRIELRMPLRDWLEAATAPPLVRRVGLSPAIAAEVAVLPDSFHRDPADRILVATARALDATFVTQDERIVKAGLVRTT
jgi:PIN domain nuclease of toxin-antitoxin system